MFLVLGVVFYEYFGLPDYYLYSVGGFARRSDYSFVVVTCDYTVDVVTCDE